MTATRTSPPHDVAVIGGGVVGCAVARRLTLDGARVVLVERAPDILAGASKGNSAILHTGFDAPPDSLELACMRRGYAEYLAIRERLNLPLPATGVAVVAWSDEEARALDAIRERAHANGITDMRAMAPGELAATAVQRNAVPVVDALRTHVARRDRSLAPVVVTTGARVALGDDVGARLKARAVLVLIGERPGLSAPDSLGAYLTFAPTVGRNDAERNCVSNIRTGGLAPAAAAFRLARLVDAALTRGLTGVSLKDESETAPAHTGDARGTIAD